MSTAIPTPIYQSEHFNCVCYLDSLETLALSFDYRRVGRKGFPKHGRPYYFGSASLLHIHVRRNNWFLAPDLPEAISMVARFAKLFQRRVAFGSSMGGFGILAFSTEVLFDQAILASPQFSLNPEIAPFEERFDRHLLNMDLSLPQAHDPITSHIPGMLLYDPFVSEDRQHKDLFVKHISGLHPIAMPFSGHPALSLFAQTGQYGAMVKQTLAGRVTPHWLHAFRKEYRWESESYRANLQTYLDRRAARTG